jgi:type II secretory pathway pseudopilin PulG
MRLGTTDAMGRASQEVRMSRTPPSSRTAMALIEVMISLSVITIGLMTILGAMGTAHDVTNTTASRERLKTIIQVESEMLQAQVDAHGVGVLTDAFLSNMNVQNVAGLTPIGSTPIIALAPTPATDPSFRPGSNPAAFKAITFTATWQGGDFKRTYYYVQRQ